MVSGVEATRSRPVAPPSWSANLDDFRACPPGRLPSTYIAGWTYTVPLIDMPRYLTYLESRLAAAGGTTEIGVVGELTQLRARTGMVVNCTGHDARQMVPDPLVQEVRGQVVVAKNPGVEQFFLGDADSTDPTYVYPHGDVVVLGGSAHSDGILRSDPADTTAILERCRAIAPRLAGAQVLENRVGLRPVRQQVRVERVGRTIHNYGHGGCGVTLSWGCARDVVKLLVGNMHETADDTGEFSHGH